MDFLAGVFGDAIGIVSVLSGPEILFGGPEVLFSRLTSILICPQFSESSASDCCWASSMSSAYIGVVSHDLGSRSSISLAHF